MASVQNNGLSSLFATASRLGNANAAEARGTYRERVLSAENRTLSAQNRSLESENRTLQARKQALQNRNQDLQQTVGELQTQVSSLERNSPASSPAQPSYGPDGSRATAAAPAVAGRVVDTYA